MKDLMCFLMKAGSLVVIVILVVTAMSMTLASPLAEDETLVCLFKDGERVVQKDLIEGNIDGTWFFKNGHASNCRTVKTNQ